MIRWTEQAKSDFAGQIGWLNDRNPVVAARVAEDVLAAIEQLESFPYSGRIGRRDGTRELVTAPYPYVVVYKTYEAAIVVLRVLHGAQSWPQ